MSRVRSLLFVWVGVLLVQTNSTQHQRFMISY
jgi:hypothetical protein